MKCIRPLIREASILYYRWARHDLQRKNATHPDLPYIVTRLRDLKAERAASEGFDKQAWRWL